MPTTGFNADERAAAREQGPVVLGGVTYHPRKLTNKRLRQIRNVSRTAQKQAREVAKSTDDYAEALDAAKAKGLDEKAAEAEALEEALQSSDEVDEINTGSIRDQLALVLVKDDMTPVTPEEIQAHIDEDLDTRDVGDLMTFLLGSSDEDPTPETPTKSS